MNEETKQQIRNLLKSVMDRIIAKRTVIEPFNEEDIYLNNPFGARLVPNEIWLGAKFERSFVTSLGQGIFEQLAKIVALGSGAVIAENQHQLNFEINTFQSTRIQDILKEQRKSKRKPNWANEVNEITSLVNLDQTKTSVVSDLYILRPNGKEEFYSFKTVKPNLDQTEIAKRNMLELKAKNKNFETYFALPFNPAGEGNLYRKCKHNPPYKLFEMDKDEAVLIGSKLWEKIGENPGTYNDLLSLFEEVGEYSSSRIRKEYLKL